MSATLILVHSRGTTENIFYSLKVISTVSGIFDAGLWNQEPYFSPGSFQSKMV